MTCSQAGKLGGQTGGKSTSPAKIEAARINAKKGGRPRKPLATLTATETAVYDAAWELYFVGVRNDTIRADAYAWRKTVESSPRLKAFGGAHP